MKTPRQFRRNVFAIGLVFLPLFLVHLWFPLLQMNIALVWWLPFLVDSDRIPLSEKSQLIERLLISARQSVQISASATIQLGHLYERTGQVERAISVWRESRQLAADDLLNHGRVSFDRED